MKPVKVKLAYLVQLPLILITGVDNVYGQNNPRTTCVDEPGWTTVDPSGVWSGYSCSDIEGFTFWCDFFESFTYQGKSIKEACCECGGGDHVQVAPSTIPSIAPSATPTQCEDDPDWFWFLDGSNQYGCEVLTTSAFCNDPSVNVWYKGKNAQSACCACGGGINAPSEPYTYTPSSVPSIAPTQCVDDLNWYWYSDGSNQYGCNVMTSSSFCNDPNVNVWYNGKNAQSACCVCGGGIYAPYEPSSTPSSTSVNPTVSPSSSTAPSSSPSIIPSSTPSHLPSTSPSANPSMSPSSSTSPSSSPSVTASSMPSKLASSQPSMIPSSNPSFMPSSTPSSSPSTMPSSMPSSNPSSIPTIIPTCQASEFLGKTYFYTDSTDCFKFDFFTGGTLDLYPGNTSCDITSSSTVVTLSNFDSVSGSLVTFLPTGSGTNTWTGSISMREDASLTTMDVQILSAANNSFSANFFFPSCQAPSVSPSFAPSLQPSTMPSLKPSVIPSIGPSSAPSSVPSSKPSAIPSNQPSSEPSLGPSLNPSSSPSSMPSLQPSSQPSMMPSSNPSFTPSSAPSSSPSVVPSLTPSSSPTYLPTCAAANFVGQTYFVVIGNECYRFQFFVGGSLDRSSDTTSCDASSYSPELNLSLYSTISGNSFVFTQGTAGFSGEISIRLDPSVSATKVQILSLDNTAKTFVGNLVFSSC